MSATHTLAPSRLTTTRWFERWVGQLADALRRPPSFDDLRGLDARTLADIGIDASEISSVEAEARQQRPLTRKRIVRGSRHA
ncbi:hypothetical protein HLB44_08550 [Aquincola sp. S2]|uniref:DUF1127 domain-containing protein n=1 Tax=Pseudaquabacterium terrae TaxID=2732868 RepID=A0ABX2EEJ5_9BURK|nr:hypothetical protein [Aquabacterium terrae]NRF67028.1 hypothetical protein [Aquabacterium terrae]